jgi:septal ring factor EnvC (AmiA/AmiB activator)
MSSATPIDYATISKKLDDIRKMLTNTQTMISNNNSRMDSIDTRIKALEQGETKKKSLTESNTKLFSRHVQEKMNTD